MDTQPVKHNWNFHEAESECGCTHGAGISLSSQKKEKQAEHLKATFDKMRKEPYVLLQECTNDYGVTPTILDNLVY